MATTSNAPGRTRTQAHSRAAWEQIKPVFTEIYLRPGVRLEDAMEIMTNQHGFSATKMMYKKRLHSWGIKKNLKSIEKENIIDQALFDYQDYPVRRKTQRYVREKERQRKIQERRQQGSNNSASDCVSGLAAEKHHYDDEMDQTEDRGFQEFVPYSTRPPSSFATPTSINTLISVGTPFSLESPDEFRDAQLLLRSLRECVVSLACGNPYCDLSACCAQTEQDLLVDEVYKSFSIGEEALSLGLLGNATSHFQIAGRHLGHALETPTQLLMIVLLGIIRLFSSCRFESYGAAIYRFLNSIVRTKLAPQHPLSTVVALLVQRANNAQWQKAIWELLVSTDSSNGAELCRCSRLHAQNSFGVAMAYYDLLEDAIEINQRLLDQNVAMFGLRHRNTQRTMFQLGRIYCKNGETRKAISSLEHALSLVLHEQLLDWGQELRLLIYAEFAHTHVKLGNSGAALNWYWTAFQESMLQFGPRHEDTIWYLDDLVYYLERQAKIKRSAMMSEQTIDLKQIKEEYAESYQLLTQGLENLSLEYSNPLHLDC